MTVIHNQLARVKAFRSRLQQASALRKVNQYQNQVAKAIQHQAVFQFQ